MKAAAVSSAIEALTTSEPRDRLPSNPQKLTRTQRSWERPTGQPGRPRVPDHPLPGGVGHRPDRGVGAPSDRRLVDREPHRRLGSGARHRGQGDDRRRGRPLRGGRPPGGRRARRRRPGRGFAVVVVAERLVVVVVVGAGVAAVVDDEVVPVAARGAGSATAARGHGDGGAGEQRGIPVSESHRAPTVPCASAPGPTRRPRLGRSVVAGAGDGDDLGLGPLGQRRARRRGGRGRSTRCR